MRIFYTLSHTAGLAGEAGGVRRLVHTYAQMARLAGLQVELLGPWDESAPGDHDLVHLAPADLALMGLAQDLHKRGIPFVVSPIIDKTYPNLAIRMLTLTDSATGRLFRTNLGAAQYICRESSGICLMSRHEEERVRRGLGVSNPLARVVLAPVIESAHADVTPDLFREKFGKSASFVLFVGDLSSPRKNVLRLIHACEDCKLPLVLVGPLYDTPYGRQVGHALARGSSSSWIGLVGDTTKLSAMSACRVFALPSLTEGIGLAALEAGTVGANVVVTKNGGVRDYFGDLVWYVDPFSVRSISAGLLEAWNAPTSLELQEHIRVNLSLEAQAKVLLSLYKAVAANLTLR